MQCPQMKFVKVEGLSLSNISQDNQGYYSRTLVIRDLQSPSINQVYLLADDPDKLRTDEEKAATTPPA